MLQLEQYKAFAYYNQSFNRRIYELSATLTDDLRKANRGAFFGSIHRTLNHILLADRIWLARFRNANIAREVLDSAELIDTCPSLDEELFREFLDLQAGRLATDQVILNWTEVLTEKDITSTMSYKNFQGIERQHPCWLAISHLFNHQTHHRGQVTTLLFQLGIDPEVTDFLPHVLARIS